MGDGNRQEVFMMMRYPVSAGPLSEGVLDEMFRVIRKGTALVDKDCTLGASVTSYSNSASGNNSPIDTSAPRSRVSTLVSKFEGTDGGKGDMQASGNGYRYRHSSASWSNSLSGSSGSSIEVTKGFYCKSAPAYVSTGSDTLNPAIVVEMFTNWCLDHSDEFVKDACSCIKSAIQDHILSQASQNFSIHFLISTPAKVYTQPLL